MPNEIRTETVTKLDLQSGDILLVKLGGEISDGTWVPSPSDLEAIRELWESVLPDGVVAVYSHHLIDVEIIRGAQRLATWPPKVGARIYAP